MPNMPATGPLCIIGAGGFGKEVLQLFRDSVSAGTAADRHVVFAEDASVWNHRRVHDVEVLSLPEALAIADEAVIAIANAEVRRRLHSTIGGAISWPTLQHPTAIVGAGVSFGPGSIICAGCIVTTDVRLGLHAHLNLATTIGHDTIAGDFFTTAPGARIGGRCTIGNDVFLGTGALLRDGISVADEAVIGMGAVVVKPVPAKGRWVGVPASRLPD